MGLTMAGLVLLVLTACSTSAAGRAGPSSASPAVSGSQPTAEPTASPTPAPARASPATSRRTATLSAVVSSYGVRQWLHCAGPGPLTLVVVPGLGATAADWAAVLPQLQTLVRTCVYDRPGLGLSPPRPDAGRTVDGGLLAHELWSLLQTAGERGPYLLLGHSFGGLVARAFVADHRPAVRGVLLAESVTPYDPTTGQFWVEARHRVDMQLSSTATRGGPHLGSVPLLVLSASRPDEDHLGGPTYGQPRWMTDLWVRQQAQDLQLSSDAIQVIARSGHVLQQDDPPAVVAAVRALVTAVRTGRRLDCRGSWAALHSTCR